MRAGFHIHLSAPPRRISCKGALCTPVLIHGALFPWTDRRLGIAQELGGMEGGPEAMELGSPPKCPRADTARAAAYSQGWDALPEALVDQVRPRQIPAMLRRH
jgi:hypothetical protein